jgi:anti-sigma B factor antagonist
MTNVIDGRVVSPVCTLLGCDGFGIRLREDSVGITVTVTGEVDLATAPLLMRALRLAGVGDPPLVVIDATTMSFIGSHGLGVILAARQSLLSRSGTLVIRHSPPRLQKTLAITRLTDLVEA